MIFRLSIPSKTFLCGEYAALCGGPSLLLMTEPFFSMTISGNKNDKKTFSSQRLFHPESPAGQWVEKHSDIFSSVSLTWDDPHQGKGGFGASTAEFLSVYLYTQKVLEKEISVSSLLDDYRQVAHQGGGRPPSGADVVAQFLTSFESDSNKENSKKQRLVYFDARSSQYSHYVLDQPFSQVDFLVLRTGKKLATHGHLQDLQLGDVSDLSEISQSVYRAVESGSLDDFLSGVNSYGESLQDRGWVAPHTQELLQKIRAEKGVLAAKGCGAMGADTIFACVEKGRELS